MALMRTKLWALTLLLCGLSAACSSEVSQGTEVFLSIDAEDGARDASAVRVAINTLVIEFERESWPIEFVVQPRAGDAKRRFSLRAWGLKDGAVLGAASAEVGFKDGARDVVTIRLAPGIDVGEVPEVNAKAEGGKVIMQPAHPGDGPGRDDAGMGFDGGNPSEEPGDVCGSGQVPTGDGECRARAWSKAVLIESGGGSTNSPAVAMDGAGNATVLWSQIDGGNTPIWGNRFEVGSGWGTTTLVGTSAITAGTVRVVADRAGNALAVWSQAGTTSTGGGGNVWSSRFTSARGWDAPTQIDMGTPASYPHVAIDHAGNAVAVWVDAGDATSAAGIGSSRYLAGMRWEAATRIATSSTTAQAAPRVAVDSAGNATAVWVEAKSGYPSRATVFGSRMSASGGWETKVKLGEVVDSLYYRDVTIEDLRVATDKSGQAIAVWREVPSTGAQTVRASRFSGSGWEAAEMISPGITPRIAMDGEGNTWIVWAQNQGQVYSIWARRFVPGSGWETAMLLENDDGTAGAPEIAIDDEGAAVAIWTQHVRERGMSGVWSSRFVPGHGWESPTLIDTDSAGVPSAPQIAIDPKGNAVAVWREPDADGTTYSIWASRYD